MSGIAVVYDPLDRQDDLAALVPSMCKALQRSDLEGPVQWYGGPGFAMGRCRPALVNQAAQPTWNEDHTICVVFHGELFGKDTQRRALQESGHQFSQDSHAEFVIHLYENMGEAFIHELNGNFAMALWDNGQRKLLIANDRYGLRPLYTALSGGRYIWASAPKAILADTSFPRKVNLAAMADFLRLGFPQGNDTMFEGIDELPPASLVICQNGHVRSQQYWDLQLQEEETAIPADDYLDEMITLLGQAAERQYNGELSVGLLLSGGLDSRIALSLLKQDSIKTFTYGIPFCDDVRFARQVAEVAGVPHFVLEIRPDYLRDFAWIGIERTEDLINCDKFHSIGVYGQISTHVDTLITGSTADSILGRFAYNPQDDFWCEEFSMDRHYAKHRILSDDDWERLIEPAYFRQIKGLARSRLLRDYEKYPSRHTSNRFDYWNIQQANRRLWNRLASLFPDDLGFRPIFFDNEVVDFAQTIPPSLRWGDNSVYRRTILRIAPELAKLSSTTTHGLSLRVNHAQITRYKARHTQFRRCRRRLSKFTRGLIPPGKKSFYVDYSSWLRHELRDWVETVLLDPRTLNRGYWNPSAVTRFVADFMRQKKQGQHAPRAITALISFELWHRMYLDGT